MVRPCSWIWAEKVSVAQAMEAGSQSAGDGGTWLALMVWVPQAQGAPSAEKDVFSWAARRAQYSISSILKNAFSKRLCWKVKLEGMSTIGDAA